LIPRGYVLVGGESSRMGVDKATLRCGGQPLVAYAIATLRKICAEVYLCGNRPDLAEFARVLPDARPGAGPLAALVTTTQHVRQLGEDALAVTLPVDVPLLPAELLAYLYQRAQNCGAWATVPRAVDRPQPLCAIFSARLADPLDALLHAGESKVMRALQQACGDSKKLDMVELATVLSPEHAAQLPDWFLNINTPEDARLAEVKLAAPRVW
jgi:molybdopterin-guanine dinucleotide biosynthesis protein A